MDRYLIRAKTSLFLFIFYSFHIHSQSENRLVVDLETAIQIATTNYFLLQTIKNKNTAIKELITERWRNFLPSVGLGWIRQNYIIQDGQDSISNEIRLNIEQVIFDGGRRTLDHDIALLEELLTREDFFITYSRLRLEVQKFFFEVLAANGKVSLNQKSLQRARTQLKIAKIELKNGFTTKVQVMNIASRVQEIELALLKSQNEVLRSKNNLKLIMTIDYEIQLDLIGDILKDFYLYEPVSLDKSELISHARLERPEILRAKINLHKLEKEKEMTENAWIPRVSVGGYLGRTNETFPLTQESWGLNFKVTFPLGNSTNNTQTSTGVRPNSLAATGIRNDNTNFNNSTNSTFQFFDYLSYNRMLLESKIKLSESVAEKNKLDQTIAIEVSKSYDSVKEYWDSIHIGNGQVYFRYESLRLMTTKFVVGEAKRSDILFAEHELIGAQTGLIDSFVKYIITSFELEWVSGHSPSSLKLFQHVPNVGNSILSFLMEDDFSKSDTIKKESIKHRFLLKEYDFEKDKNLKNLIDEVELE